MKTSPVHVEFARRLASGKETASDIYRDLYPRSRKWKDKSVHEKAAKLTAKVRPRVKAIQAAAEDNTIAERREIMQGATQRFRGRMGDFVTAAADGVVTNVGPENVNSISLKGVTSRCITTGEGDGKNDAIVTRLEIFDPLTGADMLNKMRHEYDKKELSDKPLVIILRERAAPIMTVKPVIDVPARKRIGKRQAK